jgi:hypothetical protein
MRSWLVLIALIALGAGCWSERAPAETTLPSRSPPPSIATLDPAPAHRWPGSGARFRRRVEDRCAQVVGHMFDLARQDGMNNGFAPAMLDDFQASTIESCHETEWSEESLGCYADTTSTSQMGECYRSMTTEQREDFEQRFLAVRSKHRTTSPPPPP